jgi:hypothetical protein
LTLLQLKEHLIFCRERKLGSNTQQRTNGLVLRQRREIISQLLRISGKSRLRMSGKPLSAGIRHRSKNRMASNQVFSRPLIAQQLMGLYGRITEI